MPEDDSVICYIFSNGFKKGELKTVKKVEHNFISTGFRNWKKAVDKFKAHQPSQCHTVAQEHSIRHIKDIVELTNKNASHLRREERKYLIKIMETIKFLVRQGVVFRFHSDFNDNFTQEFLLRGIEDMQLKKRVCSTRGDNMLKYTHQDFQNELIDLISKQVLPQFISDIKKVLFTQSLLMNTPTYLIKNNYHFVLGG